MLGEIARAGTGIIGCLLSHLLDELDLTRPCVGIQVKSEKVLIVAVSPRGGKVGPTKVKRSPDRLRLIPIK